MVIQWKHSLQEATFPHLIGLLAFVVLPFCIAWALCDNPGVALFVAAPGILTALIELTATLLHPRRTYL